MKINQLSTEQKSLIPIFISKWEAIAFSTKTTDKVKISQAIKEIYSKLNLAEPIISFCDRPTNTYDVLENTGLDSFGLQIHSEIQELLITQIEDYLTAQISESVWEQLDDDLRIGKFGCSPLDSFSFIDEYTLDRLYAFDDIAFYEGRIMPRLVGYGLTFDYCLVLINEFGDRLKEIWKIFQILVNNCSQIFFYEHICIVYEKLKTISVDDLGLLHNDGQPAIEFV